MPRRRIRKQNIECEHPRAEYLYNCEERKHFKFIQQQPLNMSET